MPILKEFLGNYPNDYFVETGSFVGDGIQSALDTNFQHILSIEFYYPLVEKCRERFKEYKNVKVIHGSSSSELYETIKNIQKPITFWLDAHYSGEGTAHDGKYCPILEELEQIRNHNVKNHTILIDDRRLFGRNDKKFGIAFPEITETMIINKIKEINPKYEISYGDSTIKNDIIIAKVKNPPSPPTEIPLEYKERYTMNGKVTVKYHYVDQSAPPSTNNHTENKIREWVNLARKNGFPYYRNANTYLYQALDKYPIKDTKVCIFGSDKPWFEAVAITRGAKDIGVIEYRKINFGFPGLKYWTCDEYYNMENPPRFDHGLSISSFEHDGLGRYGDPINPDGDISAMKNASEVIKKGGYLFLSVPVGKDTVVWNAHRIYGKHRFPKLIEGWKMIDSFGIGDIDSDMRWNNINQYVYQPVFVLEKI